MSSGQQLPSDEPSTAFARELSGPLTALTLYMDEIKQHSRQLSEQSHLQNMVEHAIGETKRICALVDAIAKRSVPVLHGPAARRHAAGSSRRRPSKCGLPLTKREREVLHLIGEGCSNKEGAQVMGISPRTFESHRAEAMRKLGARNTAELVRAVLLHAIDDRID